MNAFTDQDREVIYRVLALLPTIEQALQHMQVQLEELRLEESAALFKDTAEAIGSIANCVLPLINQATQSHLLKAIVDIRHSMAEIIDAYEHNDLSSIQMALTHRLIPAVTSWQQALAQIIIPTALS